MLTVRCSGFHHYTLSIGATRAEGGPGLLYNLMSATYREVARNFWWTRSYMAAWRLVIGIAASVAVVTCAVFAAAGASAASLKYSETTIGPFGLNGPYSIALNGFSHVTGEGKDHGVFLYQKRVHNLGKPPSSRWAIGMGISNNDVIAATAQTRTGRHGYVVAYPNGSTSWTSLSPVKGFPLSEATSITPDGSTVAGEVCASDSACSPSAHTTVAAFWPRSKAGYGSPHILPLGNASTASVASGIARDGNTFVIAGDLVQTAGTHPAVWIAKSKSPLRLSIPQSYASGSTYAIAHGAGDVFYVSGTVYPTDASASAAVLWTITCSVTGCRKKALHILTPFGQAFGVNSKGQVLGFDSTNGSGGFQFLWKKGKEHQLPLGGFAINNAGQIAGWARSSGQVVAYLLKPATPDSR